MDRYMTNLEWKHEALDSQKYADNLRANPRRWFRYYYERILCVVVLLAIVIAGLFAFVQLIMVGHSG